MQNKQEAEEFDWSFLPENAISESIITFIKNHCVPRADYDTAREIAEHEHNELVCLQKKLKKVLDWIDEMHYDKRLLDEIFNQ